MPYELTALALLVSFILIVVIMSIRVERVERAEVGEDRDEYRTRKIKKDDLIYTAPLLREDNDKNSFSWNVRKFRVVGEDDENLEELPLENDFINIDRWG